MDCLKPGGDASRLHGRGRGEGKTDAGARPPRGAVLRDARLGRKQYQPGGAGVPS